MTPRLPVILRILHFLIVHPSTTFGVGVEFSINSLAAMIDPTILDHPLYVLQHLQQKLQLLV